MIVPIIHHYLMSAPTWTTNQGAWGYNPRLPPLTSVLSSHQPTHHQYTSTTSTCLPSTASSLLSHQSHGSIFDGLQQSFIGSLAPSPCRLFCTTLTSIIRITKGRHLRPLSRRFSVFRLLFTSSLHGQGRTSFVSAHLTGGYYIAVTRDVLSRWLVIIAIVNKLWYACSRATS